MKRLILLAALALSACSPGNACDSYGFQKGTTAYAQCVQAEVLAYRHRLVEASK